MSKKSIHWADRMAGQWTQRRGRNHVIEIGVSPSGPIHLGFLRETILGDVAARALRDAGAQARFVLFADSMDPLRKRYPFLDASYDKFIGKPLCDIPAPVRGPASYADAFLAPFAKSLERLGVALEILRSEDFYRSGRMTKPISQALEGRERIADILREESGRQLDEGWSPVNVLCAECGRMTTTRVVDFDVASTQIGYACECGSKGQADYSKGQAKLPWRIDWPARWSVLGVTVEPFGKDHSSPGGSYATGRRICQEIFGWKPPEAIPYEWINLKGQGAMSSSKGIAITIDTMLEAIPAEVLRYLILRDRPNQAIDFDPSRKLIQIIDEYEALERRILHGDADVSDAARRNYSLARIDPEQPREAVEIPFRLLTTLVQVAANDEETLKSVLQRTGYGDDLRRWPQVKQLADFAWNWTGKFAPEEDRMQLSEQVPDTVRQLSETQIQFLEQLADYLMGDRPADEIHQQVYQLAERLQLGAPEAFRAIYAALIGKERGPRAGFFLASLNRDFVLERFRQVRRERGESPAGRDWGETGSRPQTYPNQED